MCRRMEGSSIIYAILIEEKTKALLQNVSVCDGLLILLKHVHVVDVSEMQAIKNPVKTGLCVDIYVRRLFLTKKGWNFQLVLNVRFK